MRLFFVHQDCPQYTSRFFAKIRDALQILQERKNLAQIGDHEPQLVSIHADLIEPDEHGRYRIGV